jgi:signal transduction histidine kinase
LINDILDLSKVEAGKLRPRLEAVKVTETIAASVRLIAQRADEGGIEIVAAIADDIPPLRADGRMIRQILVNLLSNAVKFTPSGGRVEIEAMIENQDTLVIRVGDNGIGIARKDIATVMAPFGQVDSALSRVHEGTGLGLPLSRLLSQLHDGDMLLDSAVGVGTTVTVRLPLAGPAVEVDDPVGQVAISAG